jgi:hypothetical protein
MRMGDPGITSMWPEQQQPSQEFAALALVRGR